ncbi:MAG TPA: hypothetical protein VIL30_04150 [Ramlibacter sp.]|jgi:hypothetical protein
MRKLPPAPSNLTDPLPQDEPLGPAGAELLEARLLRAQSGYLRQQLQRALDGLARARDRWKR